MQKKDGAEWWRGAVVYQIYPRSFFDSNGDGIGDLAGITEKLDYIAKLGVDAIWVSPFLQSPQEDFGYDVSDYYAIDPLFGNLNDFDAMVKKMHALDMRLIMDMVLNHTSSQHPWFQESRQDRTNPKADWYVWADAKPDGSEPNNWLATFGGSAWTWDEGRQQYYFHNFLASQPDLNLRNPEVMQALLATLKFWLDRGASGFRLDTVNYYIHDHELRDNPLRGEHEPPAEGAPPENPYSRQHHIYDKSRPENFAVLKQIRKLMDQYPGAVTIGELGDDNSLLTGASYVRGKEHLHMVYNFRLLDASAHNFNSQLVYDTVSELEAHIGDGWPSWSLNNHDVQRVASRYTHNVPHDAYSKVLMAMLLSIRGTVCLYQGEELGLPEAEVAFEHLQDPYGIRFYPAFKGRDGCRTPIPWVHYGDGGFSAAPAWLPMFEAHLSRAVSVQENDPASVLNAYRQFIHWRKSYPALLSGKIRMLSAKNNVLAFERFTDEQTILIILNLAHEEIFLQIQAPHQQATASGVFELIHPEDTLEDFKLLTGHGFASQIINEQIYLPAYGALFAVRNTK